MFIGEDSEYYHLSYRVFLSEDKDFYKDGTDEPDDEFVFKGCELIVEALWCYEENEDLDAEFYDSMISFMGD